MDLLLAGNYRGELLRARLARTLSPDELAFLYPEYPADAPTTLARLAPIYRLLPLDPLYAALPPAIGPIYASNNWVVDGAHSASGKPLLANDPHLPFGAPGFWYLARLKTPEREIAGGTVAGAPFVVIGHNDRIAWGFTTTASDVEDLFIEKLDPADPGRYLTPDGSAAFATREETIAVRGGTPVRLTVRSTRHGPVLSDVLAAGDVDRGYVLALAAPFLRGDDRTAEALWGIDRATDWDEFRAALRSWVAPQQNIVYGDSAGTIGFIAPGRVPIRKHGDGWLPVPGWSGDYDWTGFIPFPELPQATNPAAGHFVSANNKIVPDSYPYFLSHDWDLPNRAERIGQLLAASAAAIARDQRRDRGRYAVARGPPAGAADDPHRAGERGGARGDRAAARLGLPHGRRQGPAAAVYRLAARLRARRVLCPSGRGCPGLLGFEAAGHRGRADRRIPNGAARPSPTLPRSRRGSGGGEALRRPALGGARCRARRASPGLRRRYGAMAMAAGPYRRLRQPGLRADRAAARLGRRPHADIGRVRYGQPRLDNDPRRGASFHRAASAPGCASSPILPRPRARA